LVSFIHLHVHSQYSFLDGASSLDRLLEKAQALDMPALGLTDHNRLTGAIRFYRKARACGIKPILGAEVDIEGGHHLTLLCKDGQGYSSLCRLLTEAHLSNRGRKPEATREMLRRFRAGLIALSGCSRGEIPSLVYRRKFEEAVRAACFYRDIYGDDFFVELISYPSRQSITDSHWLAQFARQQSISVVATNNVHYVDMSEYATKELLNAIDRIIPVSQLKEQRTVEQYLKSPEEMARLFADLPEALSATEEIASRCNLELELGKPHFPRFALPVGDANLSAGETEAGYLSKLANQGAQRKYGLVTPGRVMKNPCDHRAAHLGRPSLPGQEGGGVISGGHPQTPAKGASPLWTPLFQYPARVRQRLEFELDTINRLGFCGYFLVVWDIVRWAREKGIRCQARGSAVDSLVVYTLDISTVDPIEHNLLFERFMHPLRNEMPDIDLDIDRRRRDEVRDYVYQKYGSENVACVSTINTYRAKGAIRDAGKALQVPQRIIDEACKGIRYASVTDLLANLDSIPEFKSNTLYKKPELAGFFRLCATIDGLPRHLSVHLGGLLIGDGRLSDSVPLEWASGGDIISQYDKDDIEQLGIVKMDLLSLPTLTVIEDTLAEIERTQGTFINLDTIPKNDPAAFALLRDGRTLGTFQLESPAQREMAGRMLPDRFEDVIVSISLVRPGPLKASMDKMYLPRRHGKEPVTYLHPRLENALAETLGVILYQEQVLKVAHDLAGMSYAEADGFRRAMTHDRTSEEMEKMRDSFIGSAAKNGVRRDIADKVFEQLAAFAAYGFCKAHAVTYAVIAYQTLWLKRHYPAEFMAAVLSNQPMGYYPSLVLVADARRMGVRVLPPDVNYSSDRYTVEEGAIRVSLRQLKGMSEEDLESILIARATGRFASLRDFVLRTNTSQTSIENLARVGAFDSLITSGELRTQLPRLLRFRQKSGKGTMPLFERSLEERVLFEDAWLHTAPLKESTFSKERMLAERELLSMNLSAHPLDFLPSGNGFTKMKDLPAVATGKRVQIIGSVIGYQTPPTRNGNRVVYIVMEDGTGLADVTVFSNVQEKCGHVLFRESWLKLTGKVQRRGPKALSIIAENLEPLSPRR